MAKYSGVKKYKANVVQITPKKEYEAEQFASFFSNSKAYDYLKNENDTFSASDYNSAAENYKAFKSSSPSWRKRADVAKAYLVNNKSQFSEEDYKKFSDYLTNFSQSLTDLDSAYSNNVGIYSKYATEEDYKSQVEWPQKYSNRTYDEIDNLIANSRRVSDEERDWLKKNKYLFGDIDDLTNLIAEKEAEKEKISSRFNAWSVKTGQAVPTKEDKDQISAIDDEIRMLSDYRTLKETQKAEKEKAETAKQMTADAINSWREPLLSPFNGENLDPAVNNYENLFYLILNGQDPDIDTKYGEYVVKHFVDKKYEYKNKAAVMTEEEKQAYNIYFDGERKGVYEKGTADKYLDLIDLNKRWTEEENKKTAAYAKEHPVESSIKSILLLPEEVLVGLTDAAVGLSNDEIDPYDSFHQGVHEKSTIRSSVSENMGNVGRVIYNASMSIGDTALATLLGGQTGSAIILGLSSAESTIVSAKERGLSDSQAVLSGVAAGIFEWGFEKIGIDRLFNIAKSGRAGLKNALLDIFKQMGVEGLEEIGTDLANSMADQLINGKLSEMNVSLRNYMSQGLGYEEAGRRVAEDYGKQLIETFATGAVAGGGSAIVATSANSVANRSAGKTITESGQAGKIAELAGMMDPDSATGIRLADYNAKTAGGKTASPSYIGAVYRAMQAESGSNVQKAFNVEFENYISEKLRSAGLDADPKTVSAVLNTVKNKGLNLAERSIMKDKAVADLASSITEDALVEFASKQESVKKAVEQQSALETIDARIVDAQIQNAEIRAEQKAAKKSVSKNVAEKGYTLENIAVKNSGELYVPSGDEELSVDSVALTQDTADAIALSGDMNATKKRAFFSFLRGSTAKTSLDDKHNAFSLVYHDGLYGFGDEHKALTNGILSEAEYDAIYSAGQNAAKAANVTSKKEAAKLRRILGLSDRRTGTVNDSAVRYKEHSAEGSTRVAIAIAKVIAATTGRNIELFDSTVRERMDGKENGKFDPDTNTLYIDVNAGLNEINGVLQAAMLPTLSHELVHLFAVENPTEYAVLENLIFKALTLDGKTTKTALIDAEVNRIREGSPERFRKEDGTEKSRETQRRIAAEEIVARACEDRLSNSAMMKKFVAEMEKEDSGLVRKFRAALDRAVRKIREAVNHLLGQKSLSSEARKLAEQSTDVLDEIQAQFDKLLERNIGIEQAQKNTADNSGIRYQARNGNVKDAKKLSEKDFRFLLSQAQNGILEDRTYIPLRATTPSFFIDVVREHSQGKINVLQVPLASKVEHVRQNMEEDDGSSYGDKRPHNLSDEDMVMIAKEMGHPSYIVKQYNDRYAMVVSFYNKQNKKVIVSIDFAVDSENPKNYKYEQYMNGYNEGFYNVVVTQYQPDSLSKYLEKNEVVYDKQKMNGRYQVGSGRIVTFTHDTPFINNSIPNSPESVKENDSSGVMKQERSVAKRRKNTYNEFNTNAMQWANSSSRNQNDVKILYDPRRKQYYLIGVSQDSDMGFIELNSGTRLQMEKEMEEYAERIYVDSTPEAFNTWTKDAEIGNRNGSWDNEFSRHSSEERINGKVPYSAIQSGKETDGAGDLTGTETDSRGVSYQERSPQKYSYEALTSKPDMKVTVIDEISEQEKAEYFSNKGTFARVMRDIARRAKNKKNTQTTTYLYCADLDNDILISKESFKHGAARMDAAYIAVCKNIGSILENSIVVNELSPRENSNGAYVLLGLAESKESYILVRSIVNQKTWKLEDYNELYAIRKNSIKKEDVGFKPPHYTQKSGYGTSSVISISNFLEFVNDKKLANGVLSESVIENFGSQRNYREKVSNDLMYQERVPYQRRTYWAPDMKESERRYVRSVAKNEANKTNNYLDGTTKWLYYEKNDNSYFALYSTDDTLPEPTILYACKGEKARKEYSWLSQTVFEEDGIDARRKALDEVLVSFGNGKGKGFVYYVDSSNSGIGNNDASTHSQRKSRFKPSPALRNCLENIATRGDLLQEKRNQNRPVMLQDRVPYQSARDVLTSYAEDAKNVKARSEYLNEYVERSNALDREYRSLDDAESLLAAAVAQGDEKDIARYTNLMKRKQRAIRRLNEDLRALEESKELKAIVRREKEATKRQANAEQRAALHDYRDELERKARTERIMAKTKLLSKKLIANNRENHVPDALKEPLTRFLTALEYHSPRSKRGGDTTRKERSFSFLLDDVSDALRESSAYQSQNGKMVISEDVYDEIKALSKALRDAAPASDKYVLDEMTAAELQLLDRVMTKIVHGLNSIDRAFASSGRQEIDEEGKETMAFLDKMEDQKGSDYKNAAENEKKKLTWHGLAKFLTWEQFTPATAFNRLGEAGKRIYRRIVEGWGEYAYLAKKILKFSEENWKNNSKPFSKNAHEIRANGKIYAISDAQLMYLYLADQREQGRNHLDGDGFMMPGNVDTAESDKIHMSAEARQALYDKYIPEGSEARELARKMQKFLSENCAAWGNEVTLALYGYTAFTDENYVPLITDISGKRISGNLPVTNELYRILNMGFTKSLDPKAKNALIAMDIFDVFAKHAADMAKYKALGKPVLDAVRFFGYKETEVDSISGEPHDRTLQSRIRQVYGEEAYKYFTKFLEDLNGENPKSAAGLLGKTSTWFLKNYKLAAIGFSFKTIVLQFTSYFRASYVLSGKSMTKAVTLLSRREKKLLDNDKTKKYSELAQQYSGMAAWKSLGYYDVNITRSLTEQIKGDATRTEKIAEKATAGMGKADEKTLGVLFKACCIEVIRTIDVTGLTQEDIYRKAGELLDEVIVKTQVVDSVVTRSKAMRGDDRLEKSLTSFMSEPTVAYNVLIDAVFDVTEKKKQGKPLLDAIKSQGRTIKKALISYAITSVAAAMVESAFDAWRDDEDEELWERWWNHLGGNVIENISVIGKLPFLRDGIAFLTTVGGGYANTDRMEYAAFTEITNVIKKGVKLWQDDHVTYHDVYGFIKSLTSAASYSTSIPLQNGLRKVEDLWNNTFGDWYDMKLTTQEPSFGKQYDSAFNRGRAKAEISELVGAKVKEYVKKYPEEKESAIRKKAESSVQSSLTRYYKPLYLKAWDDGDREEMARIRSALRQSGLYEDLDKKLQNWIE